MNKYTQELFLDQDKSLLDAMGIIETHRLQMVFVLAGDNALAGVLTNGDVRRFLLKGGDVKRPVSECMNTNFYAIGAAETDSREKLLKFFDLGYSAVPVLDERGRVVDVVTRDFLAPPQENEVLIRARAPARISFAGGGSDLTYYFIKQKGSVLSTSIALYAHATLIPRKDPAIRIVAQDIDKREEYASLRDLLEHPELGLLSSAIAVVQPSFGFDLFVHSDFPVGSGLGGSSAVVTSVIAAFNELRMDRWANYQMAELAFHAERLHFGIAGGWQDQYASVFGGFNMIEFGDSKNLVHPIRLDPVVSRELEACLILCDTGIEHNSGKLHEKQRAEFHDDAERAAKFQAAVDLSRRMHNQLLRAELNEFGVSLHEAWRLKQGMSSGASNNSVGRIYDAVVEAGALGGKILGAGAGGFFVFFVQSANRPKVVAKLREMGCKIRPFQFESEGVVSWRTRVA
jgi:D-glycero-alpha-D-manno-heptose-7-phosphate kinase